MPHDDPVIRARRYKDLSLTGATVVEGLPTFGLSAAIASGYLVHGLDLDHCVGFESDDFPPLAMVWKGKPRAPMRLYAREASADASGLGVVMSEFSPAPKLFRPLARRALEWVKEEGVARIVALDGAPPLDDAYDPESPRVMGAGSTEAAREALQKAGVPLLERAMMTGVSGMLLTEAADDFDVLGLLVETNPAPEGRIQDARAAATLVDVIRRVEPRAGIPTKPLAEEAARAERMLSELRSQAQRQSVEEDIAAAYR